MIVKLVHALTNNGNVPIQDAKKLDKKEVSDISWFKIITTTNNWRNSDKILKGNKAEWS